MSKKRSPWKKNINEIMWNVVNSVLAGGLVLIGGWSSSGTITKDGFITALVASAVVTLTKLRDYWSSQENEYTAKMFNFIK